MPASAEIQVSVSATEVPQYRRLVDFFQEVEDLGRVNADEELLELVGEAKSDLLALGKSHG